MLSSAAHPFATDEALHERMRATIRDLPEAMFPCTRAEATAKLGEFDAKISGLERERREAQRALALAAIEREYA